MNVDVSSMYCMYMYIYSFSTLRFCASAFKELQSIIYIKVRQQAAIQLQELTFAHLHKLSLNWVGCLLLLLDNNLFS